MEQTGHAVAVVRSFLLSVISHIFKPVFRAMAPCHDQRSRSSRNVPYIPYAVISTLIVCSLGRGLDLTITIR